MWSMKMGKRLLPATAALAINLPNKNKSLHCVEAAGPSISDKGMAPPEKEKATPVDIVKLASRAWPDWGPPKDANFRRFDGPAGFGGDRCLICENVGKECKCGSEKNELNKWLKKAYDGETKPQELLYDDELLGCKLPWIRVQLKDFGAQKLLYGHCWLCANFHPARKGNQALAKKEKGININTTQIGHLAEHKTKRDGQPAKIHAEAIEVYTRRCKNFKSNMWGVETEASNGNKEGADTDLARLMDTLRETADQKRTNCVHAVYTSIFLKESQKEYKMHLETNKMKGANYYGDLYANEAFFTKVQHALSYRLFEQTWLRLMESPVLIPATDEADRHLGIRVQFLDIADGHVKPASEFLMIRHLADASAKGVFESVLGAFTNPNKRANEMQHLVLYVSILIQRVIN